MNEDIILLGILAVGTIVLNKELIWAEWVALTQVKKERPKKMPLPQVQGDSGTNTMRAAID